MTKNRHSTDSREVSNPSVYMDMLVYISSLPRSLWNNKMELIRRYTSYCEKNEMQPPTQRTMERWMYSRNPLPGLEGQWTMMQMVDRLVKGDLDLEEAFKRAGVPTGSIRPDVLALGTLQAAVKKLRNDLHDTDYIKQLREVDVKQEARMYSRLESMCDKLAKLEARTAGEWPTTEKEALAMVGNILDQFKGIRNTVMKALLQQREEDNNGTTTQ